MDNTNENMTEDKDINKNNNGNSDDYEKICFVCRIPESRAGKMIVMPNNIYICQIVCKEHSIQLTAAELIMKI